MHARATSHMERPQQQSAQAPRCHAMRGLLLGAFAVMASGGTPAQAQSFPQQVVNVASLQADGIFDPDTGNNQAEDRNALDAVADLSIDKTFLDTGPFLVGQVVNYSIVVANAGPSAATGITITDTPENLEITTVSGACTALPCTLDTLAAGATASLTLGARIVAAGVFGNVATVESPEVEDPDPGNNSDDGGGGEAGLPVAGIRVAPAQVDEDAGEALVFTLEFDQAPLVDTVLVLDWSGTAGADDYQGAVETVTMPAGETTATVAILPVADTVVEPDETVVASLLAGDGYVAGTEASATGVIVNDDIALAATDDVADTAQDTAVDIDVLANDSGGGAPLDPATVELAVTTPPASGSATVGDDGRIHYVPAQYWSGTDTFEYSVCAAGGNGPCATATVTVTVLPNAVEVIDDEAESDQDGVDVDVLANDRVSGAPLDPTSLSVQDAPANGEASCSDGVCRYTPAAGFEGEDRFSYQVCDLSVPDRVCGVGSVVVRVQQTPAQLRVVKQAASRTVGSGDLVRYTITATNVGEIEVRSASLLDTLPAGFSWVEGSLLVDDMDDDATIGAVQPLSIEGIDVEVGGTATITYYLRVGAGVGPGVHRNVVVARDGAGRTVSNEASAEVEFEGDPLFQDSLVVGTVFDDRDGNGWQASAKASGLRASGGFAEAAYVAGSTTVERGDGRQPIADASAPLLRGIALGTLPGRSSAAAAAPTLEVRQLLRNPEFTGDFTLSSAEGTTLRMAADGSVQVEREGEAARGLSAQDLRVRREVGQVAEGLEVRYVVSNEGIDERGVPGVRLATVEGLLTETDAFGRYHIVGVDGGGARGRNFIVKVDPATLPPGTALTSPNPLVQRITPGVPVRFDFGARLPEGELRAAVDGVEVELGEVLFAAGSADITDEAAGVLDAIATRLAQAGGGVVTIHATAEGAALAFERAEAVRGALDARLPADVRDEVRIELSTGAGPAPAAVLQDTVVLGEVLFAHGSAEVRSEFAPLLDSVAARLARGGGGAVSLVGRTDRSGPAGTNHRLGLQRARAVFDALAARLPDDVRARVRVDINEEPDASGNGTGGR